MTSDISDERCVRLAQTIIWELSGRGNGRVHRLCHMLLVEKLLSKDRFFESCFKEYEKAYRRDWETQP
jgi:hypothetical protein